MSIVLSPDVERQIEAAVSSGKYPTANEAVSAALEALTEHEKRRDANRERIRRLVAEGTAALERGDYTDYDDVSLRALAEEIKREGRESRSLPHAS